MCLCNNSPLGVHNFEAPFSIWAKYSKYSLYAKYSLYEQNILYMSIFLGKKVHENVPDTISHQGKISQNHVIKSSGFSVRWYGKPQQTFWPTQYFILTRMAIIKKSDYNKCWRGCREIGTLIHFWWECKMVQPLSAIPQMVKPRGISNSLPRYITKRNQNIYPHKNLYINVHSSIIHNRQ